MVIGEGTQVRQKLDARWSERQLASDQDYAHCRQVMLNASRNYSFAGQVLPSDRRQHVEALYALLRVGDDLVDVDHHGFESPLAAIDHWEHTYQRAFQLGTSSNPVMRAYLHTARTFDIPREVMTPYFKAMRQDLSVTRYQTFEDLLDYMAGSALPVGRAMTYILGVRPPHSFHEALPGADALSIAMQLSNFWRDIAEDWRRGRVYIPLEDFERFGVSESDVATGAATAEFKRMLQYQINRTEAYYQIARQGVPMLSSGRWAVQSGLLIYRGIIENLKRNGYDPFSQRARANTVTKLLLVIQAWLQSKQ